MIFISCLFFSLSLSVQSGIIRNSVIYLVDLFFFTTRSNIKNDLE